MESVDETQATNTTSDFVVDLLSGTKSIPNRGAPPKPAPRRRNKRPKEGQQAGKSNVSGSGSTIRQALPPDDDALVVNTQPVPVERVIKSFEKDEYESHSVPESQVYFTLGNTNDFQPLEYKQDTAAKPCVMPPATEAFDRTHFLASSSASCGEELLLASVPYHTLRIEPSPALTLDTRKNRSSKASADESRSGRLKSAGSLSDDLDNLQEMSLGEPTRSSSTPMLTGDGQCML